MNIFFKALLVIPVIFSIKAALTLKDKVNMKRSIDFMAIGVLTLILAEINAQDAFKMLGIGIFLYGLGIVTYYKFKEGLNDS
ncbi:hypothetical protein Psch_01305 [Pelotomaculum schinkii]|uniref:Uncharacterized protein n=1 Tax=Pelotomaculum schinkii TaxID=78350 RepID=A0A4Y7RG74_9FIRM|nr:hypothetical protein [Pelotomaculum schinkii]TEB07750.1 hypothetical protein Psch_01305 [Pelotomaculum schinkii]